MAPVHPELGDRLIDCVSAIQGREAAADDNTIEGAAIKAILCRTVLTIAHLLDRGDGTSALDYDDAGRTASENFFKHQAVGLIATLLGRLHSDPVRSWPEIAELAGILADLTTTEDTSWEREVVRLGGKSGVTVDRAQVTGGMAAFATPDGTVTAHVHKARDPDLPLEGAWVYLLEMAPEDDDAAPTGRYALMVDDPWWGRRIQPAQFAEAPLAEQFTMGYRLRGRILESGQPVADANVSLELELAGVEDGRVIAWDSLEYNELIFDSLLGTYVEGAEVLAPIMTDGEGRWEFIATKGHGAIYQRAGDLRDDSAETAARGLARCLAGLRCAYRGRYAPLIEGEEAIIDILSGALEITGEPGTVLRVGALDDPGSQHTIPSGGTVTLTELPEGEHGIVAFRLTAWGTWDQSWGCPRKIAEVRRGETTSVTLEPMEHYTDPDTIRGRVYERMGVPASGVEIVVIDTWECEVIGTIATTDGDGYWEAEIPPQGLGGQPAIHDPKWGSLPVLGYPYSDVVLGARAYASWAEVYKPEAWRRPLRGFKNFQYCPGSVVIKNSDSGEQFATGEAPYGGWLTDETLPKFRYVEDIEELVWWGAQPHLYEIVVDGETKLAPFELRGQPFDDTGSGAGEYRAAGYYPEEKLLMGGRIHGNVVAGHAEPISANLPEAARVGLEFGEYRSFVEMRALAGAETAAGIADTLCPYCGGPAWRDPGGPLPRGFCVQCANAFGRADAMDCRTHFATPTLAGRGEEHYAMRAVRVSEREGNLSRRVKMHWRPDLYEESDDFVTQSGPGQATNAPRWFARHVDEMGDGLGFGKFDGDAAEVFTPGHDLAHFGALPEIDRDLGVSALKLVFPADYVTPLSYTVQIDCVRADEEIETRTVLVEASTSGPSSGDPFGDAVPVVEADRLAAEAVGYPWREVGLYVGVADARLVEPESAPGCRFTIVNDTPLLACAGGVPVATEEVTPVALQITGAWGEPHLYDDAVGQVFLFQSRGGDIFMQKRPGLPGAWSRLRRLTEGGDAQEPWGAKSAKGELLMACSRAGGRLFIARSLDDGEHWEEVR